MAESMVIPAHLEADVDCNVVDAVQEVFERLVGPAQAKSIDLGYEPDGNAPPTLAIGAVALREILTNLLDNAIRYCPAGSRVTVRLQTSMPQRTILEVEDNGPGIPPISRERVFERFYRMDDRLSDGSGLGLAIVREFASKAGASVELDTPAGGTGLLVRVVFPIPRPGA